MVRNFGFIHEKIEIKILILYILRRLPSPVAFEVLAELALCDDGVCYFDFADCIAELTKTGHVRSKDGKYSITAKGARNGEITENSLPFSVRRDVENKTSVIRSGLCRDDMIKTVFTAESDGSYTVNLSLSDGLGDIVSMALYAANEKQALAMERGFRKKAESIYNALIELILH